MVSTGLWLFRDRPWSAGHRLNAGGRASPSRSMCTARYTPAPGYPRAPRGPPPAKLRRMPGHPLDLRRLVAPAPALRSPEPRLIGLPHGAERVRCLIHCLFPRSNSRQFRPLRGGERRSDHGEGGARRASHWRLPLPARELAHYEHLKRREAEMLRAGELPKDVVAEIEAAEYGATPQ